MKNIKKKQFWYAGIAAVIIYIFAVTIGGKLYPGYSHISQDISQLTSTDSPIRNFMKVFLIYNILVAFFGVGLWKLSRNKTSKVGSAFIITIGILGALIDWFPINTRGTEITLTGVIHIIIVSMISLMTVVSGFLFWRGFRKTKLDYVSKVSLLSGTGFLISGPIAGFMVLSPYAGLFERIPIGIFLLWILSVSMFMLKVNRKG